MFDNGTNVYCSSEMGFRLATAEQYFRPRLNALKRIVVHADYMELAEDYADHVCRYEKFIDGGGDSNRLQEKLAAMSRKEYLVSCLEIYPDSAENIRHELAIIDQRETGFVGE